MVDFGRFATAFLVIMGIGEYQAFQIELPLADGTLALPALLAHTGAIAVPAMAMAIVGGLLIYGTIISFTMFFQEEQDF